MHTQRSLAQKFVWTAAKGIADEVTICALTNSAQAEVVEFLSQRPLHNVILIGLILDNGLVSPLNRGTFYGCRNRAGELEGVALIGHATLMETRTDRALAEFANLATQCVSTHMIMGESCRVREFWSYYAEGGQPLRKALGEHLMELRFPFAVLEDVSGLRLATAEDIDLVIPVHAQMAFEESGVNPLETDPLGFRARCLRRIEMGRTWVWIESGELIFKADIVSNTPAVVYLEGVWLNPGYRSKGLGSRCLSQLAKDLLAQNTGASVSVLVNEENSAAIRFYERVGFKHRGIFDTVFF